MLFRDRLLPVVDYLTFRRERNEHYESGRKMWLILWSLCYLQGGKR